MSSSPFSQEIERIVTKRLTTTLRKFLDRIEQFIRVEEDGGNSASKQIDVQPKIMIPKPSSRISSSAKATQAVSNFVAPSFQAL